jgi:hypothetical protein
MKRPFGFLQNMSAGSTQDNGTGFSHFAASKAQDFVFTNENLNDKLIDRFDLLIDADCRW